MPHSSLPSEHFLVSLEYAYATIGSRDPASKATDRVALRRQNSTERKSIMGTILLVVLILLFLGALPTWPHSRQWGYYPSGGLGLILLILIVMMLLGRF